MTDKATKCAKLLHPQYSDEWWHKVASKQPEPRQSEYKRQWEEASKKRQFIANLICSIYEPEMLKTTSKTFLGYGEYRKMMDETIDLTRTLGSDWNEGENKSK